MKTSNKILVSLVLTIALILTAIHVGLYAKYKKGEFYTMESLHEEAYEKHIINGIAKISVSGLQSLEIISSDTLLLEIEKQDNGNNKIRFVQKGDSLVIAGDTAVRENDGSIQRLRSYQSVILHIPSNVVLSSDNNSLSVKGSADAGKAPAYNLVLTNSELRLGESYHKDNEKYYFGQLTINAKGGENYFPSSVNIRSLNLVLNESSFNEDGAVMDSIVLNTDNKSYVRMIGANLKKIISVTKQ